MVLKYLLSALLNKARVVEKLAESGPVRKAARITAYAVLRAQLAGRRAATGVLKSNTLRQIRHEASELPRDIGDMGRKVGRLRDSLVRDVKDGVNDASQQIKHKDK
ncbi:protein NCBP2AS2-like [Polymixia lowei]